MKLVTRDPAIDLQDAAEDIRQLLADVEALAAAAADASEDLPAQRDKEAARKVHRLVVLARACARQAEENVEAAEDLFKRAIEKYRAGRETA